MQGRRKCLIRFQNLKYFNRTVNFRWRTQELLWPLRNLAWPSPGSYGQLLELLVWRKWAVLEKLTLNTPCTFLLQPHRFPRVWIQDSRQTKAVKLSTQLTSLLYLEEIFLVLISARTWVDLWAVMLPERLGKWKKSNDTVRNQNLYFPACSAMPQPTAPSRTGKTSLIFLLKFISSTLPTFRSFALLH